MYTIRQILGTTFGLTVSGVKHKEVLEKSPSLQSQIIALSKSAKNGNEFINERKKLLGKASDAELVQLKKLAEANKA